MKTVNSMYSGASMPGYATVPATSDAKEYLRLLGQHKTGLLLASVAGLVLASLYLVSTPKVYESASLVEVREEANLLDRDREQPVNFDAPTIKEEANILKSRKVLAPVVDAYDMRTSAEPNTVPVLSALTERIPALSDWIGGLSFASPYAWNGEKVILTALEVPAEWEDDRLVLTALDDGRFSLVREDRIIIESGRIGEDVEASLGDLGPLQINVAALDAPAGTEFHVTRRSLEETIRSLRSDMSTETSDTKSRMITVKLQGDDPTETAILTNAIVSQYQAVKLGSETLQSTAELEFYEQSLPTVEQDLQTAEAALADFRSGSGAINQDTQITAKLGQLDQLEIAMTELQIDRDELRERYTELHPSTRQLDKEIGVLQRKIDEVRGSIQNAPDTDRQLNVLLQREETARDVYNEINEKLQKLRIAQAGNVGSVQIWDEALAPRRAISPSPSLAVVGSILATLFFYLLYLTLRSALSTVISDQDSLEQASGLPVFMNIPRSSAQRRLRGSTMGSARRLLPGSGDTSTADRQVLALSSPEDYSVENLRGLRSMLADVMDGAVNNVLMFTSPLPSMGKSFVSLNLAVLLAQSGKRVLLIDADYQRGQIHRSLGLDNGPGLPEVVSGKAELKEAVRTTSVSSLYCITKGFSGGDIKRELPGDREISTFMQVVAPRFDIVIVDTPPVLAVSTAAALGKHAGSTIMVVKEGDVKEPQLAETLKRLSFSGVRVTGCILNSSSTPTPSHYAYYRETLD